MRLDPTVRLRVEYADLTRFGSPVTSRCDDLLRLACPEIVGRWRSEGVGSVVRAGQALLTEARARPTQLGSYFLGPEALHPEFLHPDPEQVTPVAVSVAVDDHRGARIEISRALAGELARWFGEWSHDAREPGDGEARALFAALAGLGAFSERPLRRANELGDVTFVGHACLRFRTPDGGALLIDPWLLPDDRTYPGGLAPLQAEALGPLRAVLLTHAHPDHFDPGTLLRLGADVPIVVPALERETVLAIDLARRLRELGFRDVRSPAWGERLELGGLSVTVLPFYGEQPAVDAVLHPEIRNAGNTYRVDAPYGRFALTVDSGRDPLGDARALARADHARSGPVDVLFAGCRGFGLYPVHYLFSSVARYLPFVPRSDWGQRQRIMANADEALDAAELWGATRLVPYADGGAPWYWELGLGPILDGTHVPIEAVDPAPEHTLRAAAWRSGSRDGPIASPVRAEILRPGDRLARQGAGLVRHRPTPWPYPPLPDLPTPD